MAWGENSWGGFAIAVVAGFFVAGWCGLAWGWLGVASAAGPALGLALFVGWRLVPGEVGGHG